MVCLHWSGQDFLSLIQVPCYLHCDLQPTSAAHLTAHRTESHRTESSSVCIYSCILSRTISHLCPIYHSSLIIKLLVLSPKSTYKTSICTHVANILLVCLPPLPPTWLHHYSPSYSQHFRLEGISDRVIMSKHSCQPPRISLDYPGVLRWDSEIHKTLQCWPRSPVQHVGKLELNHVATFLDLPRVKMNQCTMVQLVLIASILWGMTSWGKQSATPWVSKMNTMIKIEQHS